MDYETYQTRVLARASHRWYADKVDVGDLEEVLQEFIRWGNALDGIKKSLMYGRDYLSHPWSRGEGPAPVNHVIPVPDEIDQRLIHAMLGVATEGVEMMEAVQAFFFRGKKFDQTNLQEEFGDTEWYRAFGLANLNQTDEANRIQNDTKLEARFGSTFTEEAANNRDLENERRLLENGNS